MRAIFPPAAEVRPVEGGTAIPDRRVRPGKPQARPVERAYVGIRQAILDGTLAPGAHLREENLAAMTGTSRTPVREALRRLVADGLARAEGRHRFVSHFTPEEVAIVFDVRARLEGYAAGVAATTIRPEEIARLEELIAEIDTVVHQARPDAHIAFTRLNAAFHDVVIEATRSPQLRSLVTPALSLPLVMIKQFLWDRNIDPRRSNDQHRDIVAALAARNPEWAATAMSAHILSTKPSDLASERGARAGGLQETAGAGGRSRREAVS